jgi:hypothetical protein
MTPVSETANQGRATTMKRTDELQSGDVIVYPDTDSRDYVLPITPEHPGTPVTVVAVEPDMILAGPHAGKQATNGRRQGQGDLMWRIRTRESVGYVMSGTASQEWTVAD